MILDSENYLKNSKEPIYKLLLGLSIIFNLTSVAFSIYRFNMLVEVDLHGIRSLGYPNPILSFFDANNVYLAIIGSLLYLILLDFKERGLLFFLSTSINLVVVLMLARQAILFYNGGLYLSFWRL